MKKYLFVFLTIFILSGMLSLQPIFAAGEDEANKYYLDAYNLYKLGKLDESLEMLKKVVAINPDHAEAHFGLGSVYFRQNMFDDAVKEFTKVTRIKPEYVEAYQRLWLAYKKLGMNDKAEEELQKYKKIIEERMQSMSGGSPQVVKPVAPPPQKEEQAEKPRPEESQPPETKVESSRPAETRPPETVLQDTRAEETKPSETETQAERSVVVKPESPPPEEARPLAQEQRYSPLATMPSEKRLLETYKPSVEEKPPAKVETEYKSPYIKVDKKDPKYKHLFKPFKKIGSALFHNPFKKTTEEWKKSYVGKLVKGFLYYIVTIQIWLCIVTFLGIYFFKSKRE
ncbi:MAG: tetratricopeptide repeat protein [Candidatus Brocadia sp.]|nr:tetratricopeptide repeat protein [Candidatus Brocadia sp.]